jgi:Hemagglutinin repeat
MSAGLVQAGSRITAGLFASVAPLAVIKGADETVTSSTTLQNDDALFLPVIANATYLFKCYLNFEGGTGGSSDIKWQWGVPASATLRYDGVYQRSDGTNIVGSTFIGTQTVAGRTQGAATLCGAIMDGTLVMAGTAGNIQLQWAQNTSSGTGTIVHAQSYLALWRIS